MHNWGFTMGFGWIIPLLIILGIFYFINEKQNTTIESAHDILDKKYANGEIDEDEYKRKKEQLKH